MANLPDNEQSEAAQLARRFALLRTEEGERLPPMPDEPELLRRASMRRDPGARNHWPQVAAGVVLAAAAGLWVAGRPPSDPGQLYADIMRINAIETDPLLQVAPGTLPELSDLPGLVSEPDPDDWLGSMGGD